MSRISGHTTGNEGLDQSLAELAEVLHNKRVRDYVAEMSEASLGRSLAAGRMARRYAENARCALCRHRANA